MSYTHFTEENIYAIAIYIKEWYNKSQIAKKIWKCHTSIWRLIKKYSSPKSWKFNAKYCIDKRKEIRAKVNKSNRNRIKNTKLENFILKYIKKYWSPEQIAWRWKNETKEKLSKDTIYKYIYENHPELVKKYFRRKWKKYKFSKLDKYQLNDRKMIDNRPIIVENRDRIW